MLTNPSNRTQSLPSGKATALQQHQPRHHTSNRGSKIRRTTLRLQVKLERTHRQKKKTNRFKKKRDQLADRKTNPIYRKQITHLPSGNQTDMELRNRTMGLRQQVQHSHHGEITIKNSQSHSKCTPGM